MSLSRLLHAHSILLDVIIAIIFRDVVSFSKRGYALQIYEKKLKILSSGLLRRVI
jgi:hypothetical protein